MTICDLATALFGAAIFAMFIVPIIRREIDDRRQDREYRSELEHSKLTGGPPPNRRLSMR